jgi:hypothetical protein
MTFISIVFRDMNIAYKVFDTESKQNPDDIDVPFIKEKTNTAREKIKSFLGDYLSKCKDNKYDVLEAFMKGVVFEKRKLRESYLQEILKSLLEASYKQAIEQYLLDKKIVFDSENKEKINYI